METLSIDSPLNQASAIKLGEIIFWPGKRLLLKQGKYLKLRYKESEALRLLCQRYPNAVSRQEFEHTVWTEGYVIAHTITQTIKSLRAALGDLERELVITLPKQGYALNTMPTLCSDAIAQVDESEKISPTLNAVENDAVSYGARIVRHFRGGSLNVLFSMLLICYALFQAGGYLTWMCLEPIPDAKPLIKINLDEVKDAAFIKEHTASSYYLIKKINGQYLACFRYKGGVKCNSES